MVDYAPATDGKIFCGTMLWSGLCATANLLVECSSVANVSEPCSGPLFNAF